MATGTTARPTKVSARSGTKARPTTGEARASPANAPPRWAMGCADRCTKRLNVDLTEADRTELAREIHKSARQAAARGAFDPDG